MMSGDSILTTALFNLTQAAERLQLDAAVVARISEPREKIEIVADPILSNSQPFHFRAFVVRHNDALGPAKGGIRMSSGVSLDDVTGLAMEMSWKTALVGVPFGGGKSGIRVDPSSLSALDKEIVIRSFTRHVHRHIGPEIYIPAPDMGTNERDMGHIRDCISYSDGMSIPVGCFVTGKPVVLGGIVGRREATGRGVMATIAVACEKLGLPLEKLRMAVQGFGNVGANSALAAAERGVRIVAVSDIAGGTFHETGLDIPRLIEHVRSNGSVKGFAGGTGVPRDDVVETECDVLIPAAAGSVITEANADRIRAKIIAEGANAPLTPEADDILNARNVFIIPDILCNAGGVFVSYLEYTQETQRNQMPIEEVEQRLNDRITTTFLRVYERSRQLRQSMRHAAMDIAVSRVVDGILARGLLP